ncbi:VC0807 family protein [Vogesella oryzae]|uniref:VC0807 family protein n=1 Tax=Vogesella oryzae TaxID=1735285 RepID=UPI0015814003|nr:VC0807 family protein [Vogesella oryzae]
MQTDWRRHLPLVADLIVNLLLPWLVYDQTVAGWGERGALLWSALPPTLWSLWELYRYRRLDAMSVLVLAGIALSLLAMLGDGDSRWLLVRESLVTGAVGLVFVLSLLWRQPLLARLALAAAARQSPQQRAELQARLALPALQGVLRGMTVLWGGGLLAECASRIWLAFHWPVARVVAIAPWLSYGIMALLAATTWLWRRRLRRQLLAPGGVAG